MLMFQYFEFDVVGLLPEGWQDDVSTAAAEAEFREFPRTPVLSREAAESCVSRAGGCTPTRSGAAFPGCTGSTGGTSSSWPGSGLRRTRRRQLATTGTAWC